MSLTGSSEKSAADPAAISSAKTFADILQQESATAEQVLALLRAGLMTIVMVVFLVARPKTLGMVDSVLSAMVIGVAVLMWGVAAAFRRIRYRPILSLGAVVLDAVLLFAFGFILATGMPTTAAPEAFGMTPYVMFICLVVAIGALRMQPESALLSTVLNVVGLAAIALISHRRVSPDLVARWMEPFRSPGIWALRLIGLSGVGVTGAVVGYRSRALLAQTGAAQAEQLRVAREFGRFVDPQVARGALAARTRVEVREITVVFTDLRGFTSLSEQLAPEVLIELITRHYETLVPVIHRHSGSVNKFVGDAVMATFGAPELLPDHADRAVAAAIEMQQAMDALNARFREDDPTLAPLRMGVGICTGVAICGALGTSDRVEYSVIGDTVNTAARLEGVNKDLGTRILLTDSTRLAMRGVLPLKALGEVRLRGKAEPVRIYTPDVDAVLTAPSKGG